jgi:hypothetical protein
MGRFVEEADRGRWTLLPECLGDFIDESNAVRVINMIVDALDLAELGFEGVQPKPAPARRHIRDFPSLLPPCSSMIRMDSTILRSKKVATAGNFFELISLASLSNCVIRPLFIFLG